MAKNDSPAKEKVVRAFDYSKFDNIDLSDDEESFHPNIEKNFNIKINRTVRDRKEGEMEDEKEKIKEQLAAGKKEIVRKEVIQKETNTQQKKVKKTTSYIPMSDGDRDTMKDRLRELDRKKIWHVGNLGEVKAERTIINKYDENAYKVRPGKDDGMNSEKDIDEYMVWRQDHIDLLTLFVDSAENFDASEMILKEKGDLMLDLPHASTYLMLTCLEEEMEGDPRNRMYKCAKQNQVLAHITELAKSFQRPPRDLVVKWFQKMRDVPEARDILENDARGFADKVKLRAIEKKKEEAEEAERLKQKEIQYMKDNPIKKDDQGREVHYRTKDELEDLDGTEYEMTESVPLVEAMKEMSKADRLRMSPTGLDPLEVFESLPAMMKKCFETQEVQALVDAQKEMDPKEFGYHLKRCIDCGLWSMPMDDDEEEEGEGAAPAAAPEKNSGTAAGGDTDELD